MQKYGGGDEDVGRRGSFWCAILRSLAGSDFLYAGDTCWRSKSRASWLRRNECLGGLKKSFACFFLQRWTQLTYWHIDYISNLFPGRMIIFPIIQVDPVADVEGYRSSIGLSRRGSAWHLTVRGGLRAGEKRLCFGDHKRLAVILTFCIIIFQQK